MALDFVDGQDGFLFLRMVGEETVVGAIWAKLSARNARGQKYSSAVRIIVPGETYPRYVAAQKSVHYKTLRTRLRSGLVDVAMIHPRLTVAEDKSDGFYFLTYDTSVPPKSFFERLNATLSIPLKPDWATWLWTQGQVSLTRSVIGVSEKWDGSQYIEEEHLTETTDTPIVRLNSLGTVGCYSVHTGPAFRDAWLTIIREQLSLAIRLRAAPTPSGLQQYLSECWTISETQSGEWRLLRHQNSVLEAPSLAWLLTQAERDFGIRLMTSETNQVTNLTD